MSNASYAKAVRLIAAGRRAEQRKKFMQGCVTGLLLSIAGALLGGWMLMLAVGIAHGEWISELPTIGYKAAVLLVLLLRGVVSSFHPTPRRDAA
jgi:hypothetical protein